MTGREEENEIQGKRDTRTHNKDNHSHKEEDTDGRSKIQKAKQNNLGTIGQILRITKWTSI